MMRERFRKASRWLMVATVAGMLCLPVQSFGTLSVTSKDVVPADGTSGQNVTTGNGIKTGHIQDGAVTTTKIIDGAVTASKIEDGAVTDAKITGPISASKITGGVYQKYANIIVVAQSGGDFTDPVAAMNSIADASASKPYLLKIIPGVYNIGGNALQMKEYVDIEGSGENATKITGTGGLANCGFPTVVCGASNAELRFLTVENLGGSYPTVAIENYSGSPKITNATIIASSSGANYAMVNSGGSPFILNSSIIASNGSNLGMYNSNGTSPVLNNVSVTASGGSFNTAMYNNAGAMPLLSTVKIYAINATYSNEGIRNLNASSVMNNVEIKVTGGNNSSGFYSDGLGTSTLKNVTITASDSSIANYGITGGSGSTIKIDACDIIASTNTIINDSASIYIGNSKLDGGPIANSSNLKCVGVYDGSYNPYACQ